MQTTLSTTDRTVVAIGATAHVGIGVFPLSASGLLAPGWYLVVTALLWLAGAVAIWRLSRTAPRHVWTVPVAVTALWMAGITIGEQALGWTA